MPDLPEETVMIKPNGIHHIAVMSGDMKKHLEFFSDVLGCRLVGLFDMHGVPGAFHAFLELNEHCHFSLVQTPETKDIPIELGKTHSGTGAAPSAPGTMQHLAFRVDDETALLNMRDRIRKKGVNVIGPIDHGICKSVYFAGPDQLTLEVACPGVAMDPQRWVDPEVLERIGVSPQEADAYMAPDAYAGEGGKLAQPPYDPDKPHQAYPEDVYRKMISAPDEAIAAGASYAEPPVPATD
jgi:catechol 2,3-dioxygenase-like lactoylglutathione lyase family enzyme